MDKFISALKIFDLSQEEIDLYFVAIQEGSCTPLTLSKKTGIPRTTVYLLIESLTAKNLLFQDKSTVKNRLIAADPKKILKMAQDKKHELEKAVSNIAQNIDDLESIYKNHSSGVVTTKISGTDEVEKALLKAASSTKSDSIWLFQDVSEEVESMISNFMTVRSKNMTYSRDLLLRSEFFGNIENKFGNLRNKMKFVSSGFFAEVATIIFEDKVLNIFLRDNKIECLILKDIENAYFERVKFEIMWRSA